jgi:hypothetical protein
VAPAVKLISQDDETVLTHVTAFSRDQQAEPVSGQQPGIEKYFYKNVSINASIEFSSSWQLGISTGHFFDQNASWVII